MRVSYDPEAGAAYIHLVDQSARAVAETVPLDTTDHELGWSDAAAINLDFDADGRLLGIEVLDAESVLPAAVIEAAAQR